MSSTIAQTYDKKSGNDWAEKLPSGKETPKISGQKKHWIKTGCGFAPGVIK